MWGRAVNHYRFSRMIAFAGAFLAYTGISGGSASAATPVVGAVDAPVLAAAVPNEIGGAGLGAAMRFENSPYRGGGTRNDFVPLYVYEGKRVFLEAYRFGLKLDETLESRFDMFLGYRFEGFPYDRIPASLSGMANRGTGVDLGLHYQYSKPWGTLFGDVLRDVAGGSNGTELRAGYSYSWELGKLTLRPQFALAARDAKLNNYYYGVRPGEATASRPAYNPGSGINTEFGLSAVYKVSARWKLLGGLSVKRLSLGIRSSSIVEDRPQLAGLLGVAYDFSPDHDAWPDGRPLIVKGSYGKSTNCDFAKVMLLKCFSTTTTDNTRIAALELGRPFIERLNGLPLDFVGYLGLTHHDERGLQSNSEQVNTYMKAYYYGFPWSQHVRTRIGFGAGVSYAQRVPFVEARDQFNRGRSSSKLLNYLDLSADVSIGDLIGIKSMRETYMGIGVSHRSGIFGTSHLLGNVSGGSNYIYSHLEWRM